MAKKSLSLTDICRKMMEEGYYPKYEKSHIVFGLKDNLAIVEYNDGILAARVFFSIEEDYNELMLDASNSVMLDTYTVKPVILDDRQNIMFSCEVMCETLRDFKRFFPKMLCRLEDTIKRHKSEMKELLLAEEAAALVVLPGDKTKIKHRKPLS